MEQIFFKDKDRLMRGILSITKINEDGSKEKLQEFRNIPVQGLGYSLARLFSSKSTDSPLDNYRFKYFQLGTDEVQYTAPGATDFFYQLASALDADDYGTDIDSIVTLEQQLYTTVGVSPIPDTSAIDAAFVEIPDSRVTKVNDTIVKVQLVVDKNMAVGKTIQEIGLFIKNPDENFKTDRAMLAAYKFFKKITKTNQFSLVFDWLIQVVDTTATEEWGAVDTEVVTYPPSLFYAPIDIDASAGLLTYTPIINQNLLPGYYSIHRYHYNSVFPIVPVDTFTINADTGVLSFNVLNGVNNSDGNGYLTIRGIPIDPSFGNHYDVNVPFNIFYTGGAGQGGTGHTGGTGMTGGGIDGGGTGSASGLIFKGPRIGDIDWVMPYTVTGGAAATYDYATSQVVVLKAIVPTNKNNGDFFSAPGLDKWLVEGGTHLFTTASCIAQVHAVTRDPSGYPTNVEVIFSALAQQPDSAPNDNSVSFQTFRLYQASGYTPITNISLSGLSRLHFQVLDASGYQYNCKFFTTTGGVTTFNPDNNPSITSSLVKSGPYLKTWRFYGRTVPRGYNGSAGNTGHWNSNDPDHEIKPFGPSVHAYVTVRYGQEIANVDFRISNGHIHRRGYAGVNNDPITYESESSNIPGWQSNDSAHVLGNFYYSSMFVDFGSDSSGLSYIDKWDISLSPTAGKYALVSAFPVNPNSNNQAVHCLASMNALVHRFGVFKTANVSSLSLAKHETKGHYQAFPKTNSGRSYQKIRAWGYHGEYLPTFDDPLITGNLREDRDYFSDGIPGVAGQRRLMTNMFNYFNNFWRNGEGYVYPLLGLGNSNTAPKSLNCPFVFNDAQSGGDPGIAGISMIPSCRQMYEELDVAEIRYESTVHRNVHMYNVSGNPLTVKEIVQENNPDALTDASGYSQFYIDNPGMSTNSNGAPAYLVDMGMWATTEHYYPFEYPSWFVRSLSNSRRSQPGLPSPLNNFGIFSNVNNKCPYFYKITQMWKNESGGQGSYDGLGPFDYAHLSRALWNHYSIAMGKNDPMAKEDMLELCEHYMHISPQYLIRPYNKFALNNPNIFANQNSINVYPIVDKTIRATSQQLSGTGFNIYASRGTGLHTQLMVSYWTVADDTWRSNTQPWFNYAASGYAYGYSRENGAFLIGDTPLEGSPPGNLLGHALANNNFYRRISVNGISNASSLGTNKQFWFHNPDTRTATMGNVDRGITDGPEGNNQIEWGGAVAASSTIMLMFHEMYLKEAAFSLARLQLSSGQATLKNMIMSGVALGCSTAFTSPYFGTMSGVIGDPYWSPNAIDLLTADGIAQPKINALNQYFNVNLQDSHNRQHGIAYRLPVGVHPYIYNNHIAGYGSGVGEKRSLATSDVGFAKAVEGNIYVADDGYVAGPGRNRQDTWPVLPLGIAASLSDNDTSLSSQSILSANYFIQKGPENLASDYDVYESPISAQYFQGSDFNSIRDRASWGFTKAIQSDAYEFGMRYIAHYLAYLQKLRGII